jgi:hypothetical protein
MQAYRFGGLVSDEICRNRRNVSKGNNRYAFSTVNFHIVVFGRLTEYPYKRIPTFRRKMLQHSSRLKCGG